MAGRLYDPALGRFLEVDPVAGGSANDYSYGFGDPVNGTDVGGDAWVQYSWTWISAPTKTSDSGWEDTGPGLTKTIFKRLGGAFGVGATPVGRTQVYRGTAELLTSICFGEGDCEVLERDIVRVEATKRSDGICYGVSSWQGGSWCHAANVTSDWDIRVLRHISTEDFYGDYNETDRLRALPFWVEG